MSLALLAAAVIAILALGYTFWGRFVASRFRLDDSRTTPAVARSDGVDFVPARPFYLLGQHFSAIAAAGPIVGPIAACLAFGWLPCLLWIVPGVIFIGAVHDVSALVASVRHGARSIAEIVRVHLSRRAWIMILLFIWLSLIYVIVAFADVTASTFVGRIEELEGAPFHRGGAVAAASTLYLLLAVVMGLIQRFVGPRLVVTTAIFVPATLAVVYLGTKISTLLVLPQSTWGILILAYCFIASLAPLWLLLQPRGYLGGFVLYLALAVGVIGIFFGGHAIEQPAFRQWSGDRPTDSLFPFLFVTIACGACSGFHGLVCSGTTSKQIARESHCRLVGYGAMLLEGVVAVIALATVIIVAPEGAAASPGRIYGDGIGLFMTTLTGDGSLAFARTFGAMAFSTFVFDTLDVATRLGRYILEELFRLRGRTGAVLATALTLAPAALLVTAAPEQSSAWRGFWTLFGTSNQLLAALTLLAVTVWLRRSGRKALFTLIPMVFVMVITLWSLIVQIIAAARAVATAGLSLSVPVLNGAVAVLLMGLALAILVEAARALRAAPAGARDDVLLAPEIRP